MKNILDGQRKYEKPLQLALLRLYDLEPSKGQRKEEGRAELDEGIHDRQGRKDSSAKVWPEVLLHPAAVGGDACSTWGMY